MKLMEIYRERIIEGSICLLSVMEPCIAPKGKGNKAGKKLMDCSTKMYAALSPYPILKVH